MDVQLKKGLLEGCVLKAIRIEESYGYKIIQDIAPYVEVSESTLYPVLKRLEADGSVSTRTCEHNGRLRRYYRITHRGIQRLEEFREDVKELVRVLDFLAR